TLSEIRHGRCCLKPPSLAKMVGMGPSWEPPMTRMTDRLKHYVRLLADKPLMRSKSFTARIYKYYPYPASQVGYILNSSSCARQDLGNDDFRVPPQDLRPDYGAPIEDWLSVGKAHVDTMMKLVSSHDFHFREGSRILDLGCGSGRMIRWLANRATECEIWGVDISARHIVWCQENMSPP